MTHELSSRNLDFRRLIVSGLLLLFSVSIDAETFDVGTSGNLEAELHSKIQFDHFLSQSSSSTVCGQIEDGWRVVDVGAQLKRYTGTHTLIFGGLDLDYSDEATSVANILRTISNDDTGIEIEDNVVEQMLFGYRHRRSEFTIGKHEPKTKKFGPSLTNYLSFSLSGFDDDRIDWFSYKIDETIYASTASSFGRGKYARAIDVNGSLGSGIGGSDNSRLSLDYDFLLEASVPGLENGVLSFASRSMSGPSPRTDLDMYGVKLNLFYSKGLEFVVGYTTNDFGRYTEASFEYTWKYRHKIAIGGTDFNADSVAANIPNSIPVPDAEFLFFSYTFSISELFQAFVEFSEIDQPDNEIENTLVGLKMSF